MQQEVRWRLDLTQRRRCPTWTAEPDIERSAQHLRLEHLVHIRRRRPGENAGDIAGQVFAASRWRVTERTGTTTQALQIVGKCGILAVGRDEALPIGRLPEPDGQCTG